MEDEVLDNGRDQDTGPDSPITSGLGRISEVGKRISELDGASVERAVGRVPNLVRRRMRDASATSILTMAPVIAIILSLGFTILMLPHSGVNDCRDKYEFDWCSEEPALNVNGDLEVYLPTDDNPESVKALIAEVERDWTTNVMVIYVESEDLNITHLTILDQIDKVERDLNWAMNDGGVEDNVIYVLSISTVIKEVNSSGGRVIKAFVSGLADSFDIDSDEINETIDAQSDIIGNYAIPDEQERVDQILQEMPQNALDKLVRDVGRDKDGDGIKEAEFAFFWNRGVIIIGISDDISGNMTIGDIVHDTQDRIDRIAEDEEWENNNLTMTLTGPAPLTNAVTEESFKLFWKVFPVGVGAVALGLFIFHCDLLQTGRVRWVQGIKVVIIAGLPTLCAVWVTLGIIGLTNYEVTMTVILVGPIILALGVSYGLHITNRYAESKGTPQEKMSTALNSTGRAVLLSAMTTIIGFISLTFAPMKPIQTVGWALAGGIFVVYIMTMVMVPNLTILLDLKKPSHPPPRVFVAAVNMPIKWSKVTLVIFLSLMLLSAGYNRNNVEENIDLLKMAPKEGADGLPVDAVVKMEVYSDEFEAGQPGFLLVEADIRADPEINLAGFTAEHPYANLEGIEKLEGNCNNVENATAVSIVFLMKAIAVGVNVSGTPISDIIEDQPLPEPIKELADLIFNREQSGNVSFWTVLDTLDAQEDDGGRQIQNFLLYVFYNSMTDEMRELFISSDYQRTLIYIDMPFMDVQSTKKTANQINAWAKAAGDSANPIDVLGDSLIGVASVTIEVNNLIVDSQWTSLAFALGFTIVTLALVFRDIRYALLTTIPVGFTVAMQWLVMDSGGVSLSLVTVMIGSILVGVGIDFSIHIANRVKELGGTIEAIRISCASTGMSLFEATTVTAAGLTCAYGIPIEAITPFVTVIIILLVIAALSALLLLPAIFSFMVNYNFGLSGGVETMVKTAGLRRAIAKEDADSIDAALAYGRSKDAW
ncbi:MAG: MMPL family transporter [Candidatus Thermoplasmatota archaeon]|nr:MMPL family transporter [Candidatus Thermoplasmatota archaeon]